MAAKDILLSAGGTGGHLFPAEALAHELKRRGFRVHLATDHRAERFAKNFPCDSKQVIASATLGGRNPVALIRTLWALFKGYRQSQALLKRVRPVAAVGFGGYPTVPPIFAAANTGVACLVHEQNAILGRANRLLSTKVKAVAVGFPQIGYRPQVPIVHTGNPVRPKVTDVMGCPYVAAEHDEPFNLVVFGGSQGARFFSEILPPALEKLSKQERSRLRIVQQAREEDIAQVRIDYDALGLNAELSTFFDNMPGRIADSHFVIARAGASSVTELAVIGRPSLLVPLPGSLDGDQAANASGMESAGGAFVVGQSELAPERLVVILSQALSGPDKMRHMAARAAGTGIPDAASRLADCVECAISGGDFSELSFGN
jgi:UDP-N-acetylglucosamine--N-acetylmuramyl-(pentapeptide) pyrophosphoryl-undecaprenol N-acetylglucosamine transferase